MAFSKKHLYDKEVQIVSGYARALSFPGRLEILKTLKAKGSLCVQAIAAGHPISRESLSGHLKILREAHLLTCEERFPFTFYTVHEENLEKAEAYLINFFRFFKGDSKG